MSAFATIASAGYFSWEPRVALVDDEYDGVTFTFVAAVVVGVLEIGVVFPRFLRGIIFVVFSWCVVAVVVEVVRRNKVGWLLWCWRGRRWRLVDEHLLL